MILPFNLPATALTGGTPTAFDLTDSVDNPTYYETPGVPTGQAFLISCSILPDSDGVTVELGTCDATGSNFTPVIPLPNQPHIYFDGRVNVPLSSTRKPALRVNSKTSQTVKVVGHVELGARS